MCNVRVASEGELTIPNGLNLDELSFWICTESVYPPNHRWVELLSSLIRLGIGIGLGLGLGLEF